MKRFFYFLVVCAILVWLVVPAVAPAESMPGMDMSEGTAAADMAGMDHENYKPPEKRADDGTMAAIASGIFAVPIAGWLVARSVRKAKKTSK